MHSDPETIFQRRALIVIPGTVNYFYNLSGQRVAEALRELGFVVDVSTLVDCPKGDYTCCILSNISEILHAFGDEAGGFAKLDDLRGRCRAMFSLAIDCVSTPWYHRIRDLSAARRGDDPRPRTTRPEPLP